MRSRFSIRSPNRVGKAWSHSKRFQSASYACLQQSQQRVSTAVTEQGYHRATNSVETNGLLFDACMNSQGWTLGKRIPPEELAKLAEVTTFLDSQFRPFCSRQDFQTHFRKSSCNPEDATFEQLADNSRISEPEKQTLSKMRTTMQEVHQMMDMMWSEASPQYASIIIRDQHALLALYEKASLDFYEGRLTRGEYNRARQQIAAIHGHRWYPI